MFVRCRLRYHRMRVVNPDLPERPDTGMHVAPVAPEGFGPVIRVEEFTRSQVVEKCHGCCHWCGKPVILILPVLSARFLSGRFRWRSRVRRRWRTAFSFITGVLAEDRVAGRMPGRGGSGA